MPRALAPYRPMPTGCNRHQCQKRAGSFHVSWLPFRFPATGSCFYHFLLNVGKREGGVQEYWYCRRAELAACRLGDSEAVLKHLKADNFSIGDGERDGEVRLHDLAGSLELGRERTKDHCSIVGGEDIVDIK